MKKRVGVWIDSEKAVIISVAENEHPSKDAHSQVGKRLPKEPKRSMNMRQIISSPIEGRLRIPGETKEFSRAGNNHYSTEVKNEHRLQNEKNQYFKSVLQELKDVDEFVLFGPSMTKKELESQIIKDTQMSTHLRGVESADAMSDKQMIKWVENYFYQPE